MPAISHVKSNTVADWANTVTVFNSQGSTATIAATDLVRPADWNSAHNQYISISGNTSGTSAHTATNIVIGASGALTVSLSTAASLATLYMSAPDDNPMSEYEPISGSAIITNSSMAQNSLYFVPFYLYDEVYVSRVNFFASVAAFMSAANNTGSAGYTFSAAMYSRMSDSYDRMSRIWSMSFPLTIGQNSNTRISMSNVVGISNSTQVSTTSFTTNDANASTYYVNSVNGYRVWALPMNSTLGPGRYWMVAANSTTRSDGTCSIGVSIGQQSLAFSNNVAYQPVGTSSSASNISFNRGAWPAIGTYSATSGAFPNSVAITTDAVRAESSGTYVFPYFNFSGFSTASGVL